MVGLGDDLGSGIAQEGVTIPGGVQEAGGHVALGDTMW